MRTFTSRSTKVVDGVRYYWRGWGTDKAFAESAPTRRPDENVIVEFSDEPHVYGGRVIDKPGYHVWGVRKPKVVKPESVTTGPVRARHDWIENPASPTINGIRVFVQGCNDCNAIRFLKFDHRTDRQTVEVWRSDRAVKVCTEFRSVNSDECRRVHPGIPHFGNLHA